jgi:hypothetical protein
MKKKNLALMMASALVASCGPPMGPDVQGGDHENLNALRPTYESVRAHILQPLCISCHSGKKPPHGIDLSSLEKIESSEAFPPLVIPGSAEDSSLYVSVLNGSMPKKRRRLSRSELRAVRDWINQMSHAGHGEPGMGEPGDGDQPGEPGDP